LNVTPDSFSDGGRYQSTTEAVARGRALLAEGADVIDVGGESTRPAGRTYGSGYRVVSPGEERRRVVPVVRALISEHGATVSVDTTKPEVASAAIEAGASIVNDVSGGRVRDLLVLVAQAKVDLVLMHSRGRGEAALPNTLYDDVVRDVRRELLDAVERAVDVGVARERIWLDPGIGFAKTPEQSIRVLASIPELLETGHRVLVGASRKSVIAHFAPRPDGTAPPPLERIGGTAATVAAAVRANAHAVRVHDVAAMRQAAMIAAAIARAEGGG
jgi:dihydropteroate synthase